MHTQNLHHTSRNISLVPCIFPVKGNNFYSITCPHYRTLPIFYFYGFTWIFYEYIDWFLILKKMDLYGFLIGLWVAKPHWQ